MKTILFSLTAISVLALSTPALAQYRDDIDQRQTREDGPPRGSYAADDIPGRLEQLRDRIREDVQNGRISRDRAVPLRQRIRDLSDRESQYSRNGLSDRERADLQEGMRDLHRQIRLAEDGGRGGPDQYGRNDQGYDRSRDDDDRDTTRKSSLGTAIDRVMGTPGPR